MEQPSSTEMAMAPVYGNMANLCLLCANAQNPDQQAFIDIHGQLGMQLKILEKIQKFLTITIEAGFPLQVCASCVDKLNMCLEFVQSTEKGHEKLKSLQSKWEAKHSISEEPLEDKDADAWSPGDLDAPSPNADFSEESETEQQPTQKRKKKSAEKAAEKNHLEEYPMLQHPSILVKGSQIAVFIAEEDSSMKFQYNLGIVLINIDGDFVPNKEKISRIVQLVKKRFASKEAQCEDNDSTSKLLHSCQSCKCSFFLQEEMVSHFESLHPEDVFQCTVCNEKICGPWEMKEKHMELHRSLEDCQLDELLSTLPSVSTINLFEPEFAVVALGEYQAHMFPFRTRKLQFQCASNIEKNKWIKPDMKHQLSQSLVTFMANVKLYQQVEKRKVECNICGKKVYKKVLAGHMKSKHKTEKVKCCHCTVSYKPSKEFSHIESHHNGGENLVCKICDSQYNTSGEDQPHMTPKSDFPFSCSEKSCGKAYQTEFRLKRHMQTHAQESKQTLPCLCELCGKVFTKKRGLVCHLQLVHFPPKSVVTCEICGVSYKNMAGLRKHKVATHDPKIPCKVCGKMLIKHLTFQHMKRHTGDYKVPCKYCGKLFVNSTNCKLHEQTIHEGVKLRCTLCKDMHFKSIKAMEEHKLKHERGEEILLPRYLQPAQCSICSKVFANSVKVRQHMIIHKTRGETEGGVAKKGRGNKAIQGKQNGKWTIPCYVCLIRFMTKESYDKHVEKHHPDGVPNASFEVNASEFRYQCRHCDKTFKKKDFCNDHETLHSGGKKYACDFCGKKYSYYSDKWSHQKKCKASGLKST